MVSAPFQRLGIVLLLGVSLLLAGVGGVHLHLCLDGSEPPVSLHVMDSDILHAEPLADPQHRDVDLNVAGEAIVKLKKIAADLPFLFVATLFLLGVLAFSRLVPACYRLPIVASAQHFLRPPLRGPPLLLSL